MEYLIEQIEKKNIFQNTLNDLATQLKFVGTFGFGITGLYETVQDLLEGRYPSLDEQEIILIFLTALTYLSITVIDDVKKIREEIKNRGLSTYVRQTVETLKDIENIAIKVGEKAGFVVSSLAELLGYIFLLVPILDVVNKIIDQESLDIVTLGIYLKSLLSSIGIFYIKNLFNNLIIKLKSKRNKKEEGNTLKEHQENKDELRRILDKYEEEWKRISPETIIELAMMDPSNDYRYLDWMAYQVHSGFWLGIERKYIAEVIQDFHYNRENLTRERLLMFVDKMRERFGKGPFVWNNEKIFNQILEDPTNINNYPGYGQVENILTLAHLPEMGGGREIGHGREVIEEQTSDYLQKKGEIATRTVVRDILKILKQDDIEDDFFLLPDYFSGIDGDEYHFGDLEFNLYLNIIILDSQEEPFIIDADIGGEFYDEIQVTVSLSSTFSEKDYKDIQMILNDYVRHEVEHVIEYLESGEEGISPEGLSPYEYYTQPHEIRAQQAGFKRRAKLENKPLEDIIYDYLEYRQSKDKLSPEQKKSLMAQLSIR